MLTLRNEDSMNAVQQFLREPETIKTIEELTRQAPVRRRSGFLPIRS